MSSNVVDTYAWLASRHLPPARRAALRGRPGAPGPRRCWRSTGATGATSCARSTAASRTRPSAQLREDSWELFHRQLLTRSFPDGFARVRAHRALGHRTLLITGALDFIIEPIRPLFDDIVCAEMGERDGRLTGQLTTLPPIGEARALLLADYAEDHSLSLEESVAYADSASDLAMLEAVGFPVAVNPEAAPVRHRPAARLARRALGQGRGRLAPAAAAGPLRRAGARRRSWDGRRADEYLLFERSLPRFAAARSCSSFGSGRGAGVGPLRLVERDAPACPAEGWVHVDPVLSGICGSDLATLDGRSSRYFEDIVSFPFVPGPRGRRRRGRGRRRRRGRGGGGGQPGRAAAGARLRGPGDRAAVPRLPGRTGGELRAPGLRPHPARPADRVLRRHRGRLVDVGARGAREPALRRARRAQRRRRGDRRAGGLRGPRRARRADRRGRRRGRARRGDARAPGHRRRSHLATTGLCPTPSPCWWGPATRTSSGWPASSAAPRPSTRPAAAGRAPPQPLTLVRRRVGHDGDALGRGRRRARLCGQPRVDRAVAGHRAPAGHGCARRHAGQGHGGPGAAVAPRGAPGRGLRLRDRARHRLGGRARARPRASTFALALELAARSAPAGSCRPPTRSPASRRRWPTPAPPAGAAPSRSHSTYGKDRPDEPPTRLRPRGGQVSAPDLVLERRGLHARDPARGEPRHLRPRTDGADRGPLPGHPPRAAPPARRSRPAARAAQRGHEADDLLRRRLVAPAADGGTRHPPDGDRDGARPGRRGWGGRRRPGGCARPAPAHDRGRAAPRARRPRLRRLRPARPLDPARRRGPREPALHRADRPGRGRRDQQAGRHLRPLGVREHQPRVDGRRPQERGDGPGQLSQPAPPPQPPDDAPLQVLHGPARLRAPHVELAHGAPHRRVGGQGLPD